MLNTQKFFLKIQFQGFKYEIPYSDDGEPPWYNKNHKSE